jgi:hypothetical protein
MTAGRSGRCGRSRFAFTFRQDGIFAELKSTVGNELSKAGLNAVYAGLIKAAVRKESRDDKKNRDGTVQPDDFQAV